MSIQIAQFKLTSEAPLIMHNNQLANPLNKFAKKLKEISSKRKKVEADYEAMANLEFRGGIYMGSNGPVIPGVMVEATCCVAARKTSQGKEVKAAVFTTKDFPLLYDGPKDIESLWATKELADGDELKHVDQRIVSVGKSKVVRTRPIFSKWAVNVELHYEDSVVTFKRLTDWLTLAGMQVGMGDNRPRYGRFSVTAV